MMTKRKPTLAVIRDFSSFTVVEVAGKKPLTGADPVLLDMVKRSVER